LSNRFQVFSSVFVKLILALLFSKSDIEPKAVALNPVNDKQGVSFEKESVSNIFIKLISIPFSVSDSSAAK
jgi:hypothetical protein